MIVAYYHDTKYAAANCIRGTLMKQMLTHRPM